MRAFETELGRLQASRPCGIVVHADRRHTRQRAALSLAVGAVGRVDWHRPYGQPAVSRRRLTINRIDTITRDTFAETVVGLIAFASRPPSLGLQTFGRSGRVEVLDVYARPGDLRTGYREPIKL